LKIEVERVGGMEGDGWDLLVGRGAETVAFRAVALVKVIDLTGSKKGLFQRLVDVSNELPGCGVIIGDINDVDSVGGAIWGRGKSAFSLSCWARECRDEAGCGKEEGEDGFELNHFEERLIMSCERRKNGKLGKDGSYEGFC
jgi:hypothetical protein